MDYDKDLRDDTFNVADTDTVASEADQPSSVDPNGFHERLDTTDLSDDDDFTRSLDPNQNPHIEDQLNDPNLQAEAEQDYI